MNILKKMLNLLIIVLLGTGLFACRESENAVDEAGDAMRRGVDEVKDAADDAGRKIDREM
jgi:hypothetical protein